MLRAGLYARVSLEEQAIEGYSIDAQVEAMRHYADGQGWTVISEYIDPGFSGCNGDRPAFQKMMADAEAGHLDVVAVHKLDRYYRNLREQLDALGRLETWGVSFVSVVEAIDYSTPWGKLVQNQLGAFNQFYLDNLRLETIKGKRGRAKAGKSNASITPYGYRRTEEGADVVNPETSPAVLLAFEMYSSGKYSDADVAGILTRSGFLPSARAQSGRWTREAVRYLLTNPFYAGMIRHGDELFPGQHEALIDLELWERVQAVRHKRWGGGGGIHHQVERVYLLAGLARCHLCRLHLVAQTHKYRRGDYAYLRDVADRRGFDCPAAGRGTRVEPLDEVIGELVARLVLPPDWRKRVIDLMGCEDRRAVVEQQRIRLAEKLKRLRKAYFEVDIDEVIYRRERAETQAQLDALVIPEENDVLAAGRFLETLADVWITATQGERKELLALLLEAVFVDVLGGRVVYVQPQEPFVNLFHQVTSLWEHNGYFYLAEKEDLC